jgi:ABC-type transport system involved in resistance to organic solvents, periplasmic component
METKANYVLIGVFTLAVVAGVFGFVYWFQNVGSAGERAYFRVLFDGSVSGLRTGGSVLFNGIKVGEVTKLQLNPQRPQQVIATIAVDHSVAVRPDTEIGLEFQGLTGIASLSLKGGSVDKPVLVGSKENPPVLIAPRNATQDVTQTAREVLRKLDEFLEQNQQSVHDTLANLDKFTASLAANSKHIDTALENIDRFTGTLAKNSGRIDKIAQGLQNLTGGEDGNGGEINAAAKSIRTLVDNVDKRTAAIEAGINRLTGAGARQIDSVASDAHRTLAAVERAVRNLDRNPSRVIFGGSGSSLPEYNGRR